jgi:hypothetical protein
LSSPASRVNRLQSQITGHPAISEEKHGPPDTRHYDFLQTYKLQGITNLHLESTPVT